MKQSVQAIVTGVTNGRLPRGRRGLKHLKIIVSWDDGESPPTREAWIETSFWSNAWPMSSRRLPRGRRGLKLVRYVHYYRIPGVASHAGGVD